MKTIKSLDKVKKIKIAIAVVLIAVAGGLLFGLSHAASRQYDASSLNSGCKSYPTLSKGSSGACVKALQVGMNNYVDFMNFFHKKHWSKVVVDGKYGDKTKFIVALYQGDKKIPVTGTVNSKTWSILTNDCRVFRACVFSSTR
jgi:peptidoglycan hydrolase-like protein with peptidoglycan-binding domain